MMTMMTTSRNVRARIQVVLRGLRHDDRGNTTENVIWIAGLASVALMVLAIWGPQIVSAINRVNFAP